MRTYCSISLMKLRKKTTTFGEKIALFHQDTAPIHTAVTVMTNINT